jgi:hypothetical protein
VEYIRRGGILSQNLLDLRWVIGQISIFGMTCGVGINH